MMKSDPTIKTFATLRVAGDGLSPEEVTKLLKIRPTHTHVKGQPYPTGKSKNIMPNTGMWLFSTAAMVSSTNIFDHKRLMLVVLGWVDLSSLEQLGVRAGSDDKPSNIDHAIGFQDFSGEDLRQVRR